MPIFGPSRPVRFLLVALVVILQVPALFTLAALAVVQYRHQREIVVDEMVERSRLLAVSLREQLEKVQSSLEELALEVPDDASSLGAFHALARSRLEAMGVDAIALANPQGQLLVNTRVPFGSPLPRASSTALQTFATGKRSVIDLTSGALTGQAVAGVSVPVVRNARIAYVLNAGIAPGRFFQLLDGNKYPPGWILAIIDSQGLVVARAPEHEQYVGRRVTPELQARIFAAGAGTGPTTAVFETRTLAGVDVVTSMRRSPVNGWTVLVSVPLETLVAPAWRSVAWMAAGFLALLSLGFWAAVFISSRIERSIRKLRDAAAVLPQGMPFVPGRMHFAEAEQLSRALASAQRDIEAGKNQVARVTQDFNRRLLRELEANQLDTARELHDSVGSSLAGVSLLLANARAHAGEPRLALLLEKAQEQVNRSAQELREISRGMTPAGTEAGALLQAIEQFAADLVQLQGIDCTLRARGDLGAISSEAGTHVFRIMQEACSNAIRHGQARAIRLTLLEHGGWCRLAIDDDGTGCDFDGLPVSHPGLGLRSMQMRARAIEGLLQVRCRHHGGCRVQVTWPLHTP